MSFLNDFPLSIRFLRNFYLIFRFKQDIVTGYD